MRSNCYFSILLVLSVALAACGGAHAVVHRNATPAASVAGGAITNREVQTYLRYATRFFSAAYPGTTPKAKADCGTKSLQATCTAVRHQVLARLLQQRVVLRYARTHHIALTPDDTRQVDQDVNSLLDPTSDTADLYDHSPATIRFLRHVVSTQRLVLKVEDAVVGPQASSGFEYHIEKLSIPPGKNASKEALNLATDGRPIPSDAITREEWEAPFRLRPTVAASLARAQPGDYIGPYRRHNAFLVLHVLGKGRHTYGRPAHVTLLTRLFRTWLQRRMNAAHPQCYMRDDRPACNLALMKSA